MRPRPLVGLLLSLVVTATAGAATIDPARTVPGGSQPAAAAVGPGAGPGVAPGALPPPPGKSLLVSRKKAGPSPFPDAGSIEPSASANGMLVAFTSIATNLVAGDEPGTLDVFVIDRRTNIVRRAPRPPSRGGRIGTSTEPSISADGRIVAFTWLSPAAPTPPPTTPPTAPPTAPPVTPPPTCPPPCLRAVVAQTYVYAWNLGTNRLEAISRNARGAPVPGARTPSVSANGRYVAYTTSFDIGKDQDDAADDVVRYDRVTRETLLLTLDPQGRFSAGSASQPSISGDGTRIAFVSNGGDTVVNEPTGAGNQVYVRDVAADRTVRVSVPVGGGAASARSEDPAISQDGAWVAFVSAASDLVAGVSSQVGMVYRRNIDTGRTDLVTVTPSGSASLGASGTPAITADGNMVAFYSGGTDLVSGVGATPGGVDPAAFVSRIPYPVYLRDMAAGETVLISVTLDGTAATSRSPQPAVAALGRYTFYASESDRVVAKDGNQSFDIFVRDLPPMPVLNPGQLDLGSRAVKTESAPLAAVLTNIGWSPLAVNGASIGGANAKDFRVATNGCRGIVLRRSEACTISVLFTPSGKGVRSATLNVADALPTSTLTTALRGRGSEAKLVVKPAVGRPGTVVIVQGSGFPKGSLVKLRWSRGITQRLDPIEARDGTFRTQVLIFHNDVIGRRELIAESVRPGEFPSVSVPVLVTEASAIPPQFSLMRFVDLPLVLVIRG